MIIAAAIKQNEKVYSVPQPGRHDAVINLIFRETGISPVNGEQGFLTESGQFVNRKQAAKIAFQAGQTKNLVSTLFSEDLW